MATMADPTRALPTDGAEARGAATDSGEHRRPAAGELEEVSLLLVDDRPENLLALEAILEPLGQRMVRAQSGDEALKHLLSGDFAVILLDVQMPGMNGFETAQLIKARERSRHIPIIFLTAINKDEAHAFKGYEVGAVDYMSKPFEPDVLRSKVAVFVDLYRKQQQLKRQEEQLRESERRELLLRHRAELLESETRLAQVIGSALDAILTVNAEGSVTLANAAAERMFGRSAAELLGEPLDGLFEEAGGIAALDAAAGHVPVPPPATAATPAPATPSPPPVPPAPPVAQRRARAATGAAPHVAAATVALFGRRASGDRFPAEASVSRLAFGGNVTYTIIVRDVSERRRAEEALRTQAASLAATTAKLTQLNAELQRRQTELQHAMTARNRFYASMSHELRTPINAIIGYATLLLDDIYGPLNDRQRQGLQRSQKAAKHLLELVNDVLDLSKIEAGKIELSLQPVAFPALVEDLFVTVRPLADEHGSPLALHAPAGPTSVVTDPRRVRQILLNLLSNAIKFGGGRPIEVHCAPDGEGVSVEVRDHGAGIPPEHLERIFDEFVQLGEPGPRAQGTGLGLPISQRLARLLGGDLTVSSVVGEGSTFRLLLPPMTAEPDGGGQVVPDAPDVRERASGLVPVERADRSAAPGAPSPATPPAPEVARPGGR